MLHGQQDDKQLLKLEGAETKRITIITVTTVTTTVTITVTTVTVTVTSCAGCNHRTGHAAAAAG